jgi:hypothetical protein
MHTRAAWPPVASLALYTLLTAIFGRDVLASLGSTVVNDAGDPLLTSAILYWNAHHVPYTEAWWQLPFFYPTRDVLAFSEHLLGLSVIATPLVWATGDALVAYNLVLLLTFPLSAMAMYALVYGLTRSAPGAFVAGLAYGFAPYRISHLPHIQILAVFWAPLALLALHAYVESSRPRWLWVYGVAWLLLAMTNGYALAFFSLLVGFWTLWFVVARRRWRHLTAIAAATVVAALPLVPILYKYATVHARHGFVRGYEEVQFFSADLAAVLCASGELTFWGWLQVHCRLEGELFPGAALLALCLGGLVVMLCRTREVRPPETGVTRIRAWASRVLFLTALVEAASVVAVLAGGPRRIDLGPLARSASSIDKPLAIGTIALVAALLLHPGARRTLSGTSAILFYLLSAVIAWMLTLGPNVTLMGNPTDLTGPYLRLMGLPGFDSLRVPARFWTVGSLCLSAAAGIALSHVLHGRSRRAIAAALVLAGGGVLADGWVDRLVAAPGPGPLPRERDLAGALVLELPAGVERDLAAEYRAIVGGWRTVNGASGNQPRYYLPFIDAVRAEDPGLFAPFRALGDLHVAVPDEAERMHPMLAAQPDAEVWARERGWTIFRLPRRPPAEPAVREGVRLPIGRLESSCGPGHLERVADDDDVTYWACGQVSARTITADLGQVATVGTVVYGLGPYAGAVPWRLDIDTSVDGVAWVEGWRGSTFAVAIETAMAGAASIDLVLPFRPRPARFVRLSNPSREDWVLSELEIWTGR